MSNATSIHQLERESQYLPDGAQEWISEIKREAGRRNLGDDLTISKFEAVLDTVLEVSDAGTRIWGYAFFSGASSTIATFVQTFDVADSGVTSGTTEPDGVYKLSPTKTLYVRYHPYLDFTTALSLQACTTSVGTTAPAAADRPNIWVVHSAI